MLLKLLAVVAVLTPASVAAQAAGSDAPSKCEIHVWPANALHTLTEGAVWNNVIDSAFTTHPGRTPERQVPPHGPLDPAGQLALLSDLDLPTLFHSPGGTVVLHDATSARRPTTVTAGRQTASTSPCYVEITVAKNFFNRSGLTSNTLRTLFILDDYGDRQTPIRSFVAWGTTALAIFPAKQAAQAAAADAEIAAAFQANLRQFSGYAFAIPRKK